MIRRVCTVVAGVLLPLVGGASGAGGLGTATAGASVPAPRPAGESAWAQPGSDSRHDYYNPDETSLTAPNLYGVQSDWHVTGPPVYLHQGSETLPVIGGGRVYLRCATSLCDLDLKTGAPVHSKLGPTCNSSLSVGGLTLLRGRLLAAMACDSGYSSTLYTIDTDTGSYATAEPIQGLEGGVVVANGHLYGTDGRTLDSYSMPPPSPRRAS